MFTPLIGGGAHTEGGGVPPAGLGHPAPHLDVVAGSHRKAGVGDHQDATLSRLTPEDASVEGVLGDRGCAGSWPRRASQGLKTGVHAGQDGYTGMRVDVEVARSGGRVAPVCLQQVLERVGHALTMAPIGAPRTVGGPLPRDSPTRCREFTAHAQHWLSAVRSRSENVCASRHIKSSDLRVYRWARGSVSSVGKEKGCA